MGSYIPPDSLVGGVLATAFAISGDLGIKAALALGNADCIDFTWN